MSELQVGQIFIKKKKMQFECLSQRQIKILRQYKPILFVTNNINNIKFFYRNDSNSLKTFIDHRKNRKEKKKKNFKKIRGSYICDKNVATSVYIFFFLFIFTIHSSANQKNSIRRDFKIKVRIQQTFRSYLPNSQIPRAVRVFNLTWNIFI